MIFVDANVFMYAVGGEHPLRERARQFLRDHEPAELATSSEALQELLHAYLPVERLDDLDAALRLATERVAETWPVEKIDVLAARDLADTHPGLSARDLIHLACCIRHDARSIMTFDRGLRAAYRPAR